jgi:hypothetical protein
MDIPAAKFLCLTKTLLEKGDRSFYDFLMVRYGDEPKQGAKTVRLKEMEDTFRILAATVSWTTLEKSNAGIDGLSVMVPSPLSKQMP